MISFSVPANGQIDKTRRNECRFQVFSITIQKQTGSIEVKPLGRTQKH